jgi:hypothetical protein
MGNHVHLVIQTSTGALSRLMQRLNTGFAIRFNRRNGRRGYVLMDRFNSRIVGGDGDLLNLVRYVHANPVASRIVPSLDALASYPWSGHAALVGCRAAWPFEAVAETLSLFDDDAARARAALLSWMAQADLSDPAQSRDVPAAPAASSPLRSPRHVPRGGFDDLLRAACARYALSPDELRSGSKQPRIARARAAVAHIAVIRLGESSTTVARALGVGRTAVSSALDRGRRAAEEDGLWQRREDDPAGRI